MFRLTVVAGLLACVASAATISVYSWAGGQRCDPRMKCSFPNGASVSADVTANSISLFASAGIPPDPTGGYAWASVDNKWQVPVPNGAAFVEADIFFDWEASYGGGFTPESAVSFPLLPGEFLHNLSNRGIVGPVAGQSEITIGWHLEGAASGSLIGELAYFREYADISNLTFLDANMHPLPALDAITAPEPTALLPLGLLAILVIRFYRTTQ
jgi:hypothetical protein